MSFVDLLLEVPAEERARAFLALSPAERAALGEAIDAAVTRLTDDWYCDRTPCDGEPHGRWRFCAHPDGEHRPSCRHARDKQRPPPGDWYIWLVMAGRGWGKTLTASQWLRRQALAHEGSEWAIVAPTNRTLWRNCIDGPSGILRTLADRDIAGLNRAAAVLTLTNGARIYFESAEVPDRLRGSNLWGAWCDELGSWSRSEAWYEGLVPSVRIGEHPQIVITTTPKPTLLMRDLANRTDGSVRIVSGPTWENASNLSSAALDEMRRRYDGTRLGRQELRGELLEEIEGALWLQAWIDDTRLPATDDADQLFARIQPVRVIVAIDPAGSASETSDETGIIVAAKGEDGHGYVLEDLSGRHRVEAWPAIVMAAVERWSADRVVAEVNYGGDYIGRVLKAAGYRGAYATVHATRGKQLRAEPVAMAYERARIHHVGEFERLEEQMREWVPGVGSSPDRVDALVWAMTYLDVVISSSWADLYRPTEEHVAGDEPKTIRRSSWASVYRGGQEV